MASSYSELKFELIGVGEQSGFWGSTTNTNIGTAIEEAISGQASVQFPTDADLTLTLVNTPTAQLARNFCLNVTSAVSLSTTRNLVVPAIHKPYMVVNATTGGRSIVVKNATGTGITIPNGLTAVVYNDGTNVVSMLSYSPTLTIGTLGLSSALSVANGGTGAATLTGLIKGNGTSAMTAVTAPTGTVVGTSDTQTLSNKTIEPRVLETTTFGSSYLVDSSYDQACATLQNANIAFSGAGAQPTGTKFILRIKDDNTPRTLSWATGTDGFRAVGVVLPTATTSAKTLYVGMIYNSADRYWDVVAVNQQA